MTATTDQILSPQAAAKRVGCGRSSIVRALQNRELPAERGNDRRWRIRTDDLDRWAAARSVTVQVSRDQPPDTDRTPDRTDQVDRLRKERDAALRKAAELRSERDDAFKIASEAQETAAELRGELTGLRGQLITVEAERDRWHAHASTRWFNRIWNSRPPAGA